MSKQSRARAAPKVATSAKASAASRALPNSFFIRWGALLAGGMVVLGALAAYHNSFSGSFTLDDSSAITNNPTIRQLESALSPPNSSTVGGRPVLNLTFALNYALGGMNVWGYHAFNLFVHTLAGLALFGIVRRTLASRLATRGCQISDFKSKTVKGPATTQPGISNLRFEIGADATPLALAVAVIWIVHPLQTEAVTYVSQRAESLMGLFYLLTLYCFVRSADKTGERQVASGERPEKETPDPQVIRPLTSGLPVLRSFSEGGWSLASICCCLLGMATKEVMVSAPLMVLLYDRTFAAGSFREAWRLRWRYYLGLAGAWLLLARLMTGLSQRNVGFDQGVTWWHYALTSCRSVVLYGKLAVWPHPLVFDYGTRLIRHATEVVPSELVLAALLAGTITALRRWPAMGFLGAWFFVILAPTSSVVPVALQPMAEHRIYLSLAAVVVLGVLGLHRLIGRGGLMVCAAAAVGLGWLTVQRNKDYRSELTLWSDTVTKCPDNARAHQSLGDILMKTPDRMPDAIAEYEAAVRLDPDSAKIHNNLGNALMDVPGRLPDAIAEFEATLRLNPGLAGAHNNLGIALLDVPGRLPDAMAEFEAALRLDPGLAAAHNDLGIALLRVPERLPDAMAEFEAALRLDPDFADAHENLGIVFFKMPGRMPDAITHFEAALRLDPGLAGAHDNLGSALLNEPGRLLDAIAEYEAAVRLDPDSAKAHYNLGSALLNMPGRVSEAMAQLKIALRLDPDFSPARELLDQLQNLHGLEGAAPLDSPLHSNDTH